MVCVLLNMELKLCVSVLLNLELNLCVCVSNAQPGAKPCHVCCKNICLSNLKFED